MLSLDKNFQTGSQIIRPYTKDTLAERPSRREQSVALSPSTELRNRLSKWRRVLLFIGLDVFTINDCIYYT